MKQEDILKLEKELASYIAKDFKFRSGKGPTDIQVKLMKDYVLVKLNGYLLQNEVELAKTEHGYFDVKLTRQKWARLNRDIFIEKISEIIGIKIQDIFYDLNPEKNIGIMILLL